MISSISARALLRNVDVITAGQGRPLALAHGAGGNVEANFGTVMSELSRQRSLLGTNYPGSGTTPPPGSALTMDELADALVSAMLVRGHERFPVAGVSLGCAVAITAAARHPEHVSGLVLSVGFARADANLREAVEVYQTLIDHEEWLSLARFLLLACSSPTSLATLSESNARVVTAGVDPVFATESAAQLHLAARVDVRGHAACLNVPTQVCVSGQDRLVLPSSTQELGRIVPGAQVITYPDAGHIYVPHEARTWTRDLSSFLDEHDL